MNIRKYKFEDRESLTSLWQTVFPDDPPHNDPSKVIDAKLAVDDLIFVAEQDGQIVGACMAGYDGHRGWLYTVGVLSNQRRNGLGSEMVTSVIAKLKELGCIKVNLQIRSTNYQVAAFYKSLGFAEEERLSMGAFIS